MDAHDALDLNTATNGGIRGSQTVAFGSTWEESEVASLEAKTPSTGPEYFKAKLTGISAKQLAQSTETMEVNTVYVPTYQAGYHSNGYIGALEQELKRYEIQDNASLSEVLADDIALFIAWKINQGVNKSVPLGELHDQFRGPDAWIPFSKLSAARVVEIVGNNVCLSARGVRLVEAFTSLTRNGG